MTQQELDLIDRDVRELPHLEGSHYGREEEKVFGALREGLTVYISSDKSDGGFKVNPRFEHTHRMLQDWALALVGTREIRRAYYFTLPPGKVVHPHVDSGPYFRSISRFMIALSTPIGCVFDYAGIHLEKMKIIPFDPQLPHSLYNGSAERWTFLVFDAAKVEAQANEN